MPAVKSVWGRTTSRQKNALLDELGKELQRATLPKSSRRARLEIAEIRRLAGSAAGKNETL